VLLDIKIQKEKRRRNVEDKLSFYCFKSERFFNIPFSFYSSILTVPFKLQRKNIHLFGPLSYLWSLIYLQGINLRITNKSLKRTHSSLFSVWKHPNRAWYLMWLSLYISKMEYRYWKQIPIHGGPTPMSNILQTIPCNYDPRNYLIPWHKNC